MFDRVQEIRDAFVVLVLMLLIMGGRGFDRSCSFVVICLAGVPSLDQSNIALLVPEFCLVFRCHLVVEHFSLAVEVEHVLERFRFNVSKGQLSLICRLFREIALHVVVDYDWGLVGVDFDDFVFVDFVDFVDYLSGRSC
jgi:hypothetical protein